MNFFKNFKKFFGRQEKIEKSLKETFNPLFLNIINESSLHSGNYKETHFKIIISSEKFKNLTKVQRHQEIYKLFKDEMGPKEQNKLHALSIVALTEEEWKLKEDKENLVKSPGCLNKNDSRM